MEGYYEEYFPDGKIKIKGQYGEWPKKEEVKVGKWQTFDASGNLIKEETFNK